MDKSLLLKLIAKGEHKGSAKTTLGQNTKTIIK